MTDLDQNVKLSCSPLIQRSHSLADQWAEIETQLEDFIQTVEHLVTGV